MKNILLAIFLGIGTGVSAQTVTQAEYFIGADPGPGNGTSIPVTGPSGTVTLGATIPVSGLTDGFHNLRIRAKSELGWGTHESRTFMVATAETNVDNITAAEYFIDNDPGTGNGSALSFTGTGSTVTFTSLIPTTALSDGFHTLNIRTYRTGGWGMHESRTFYIAATEANAGDIIAAEYFIDNDPGVGNGTALAFTGTGNTISFSALIPTATLSDGFHTLKIRVKRANGWGTHESRNFYIVTTEPNVGNITAAEYFIDTDPGAGNGTAITFSGTGNMVTFAATIPTASLSPGFHSLNIRTRRADGWGLAERRAFYIAALPEGIANINAAEYFIDTDPGVGNGAPLTVNTPGTSVNQNFLVNIPMGTTTGAHLLFLRTRDVNGNWGLFETDSFFVTNDPLPVSGLDLKARKQTSHVALDWTTLTETNSMHFEIERSQNGIAFEKIGEKRAAGTTQEKSTYTYDDYKPFEGVNFYRLKQVDIDGKFVYSGIVSVLFSPAGGSLVLYPNPAKDFVVIDYKGKASKVMVQVYNNLGQLVHNQSYGSQEIKIDLALLSPGQYTVRLTDGMEVSAAKFVKN
jgi:hypothetical protein